MLTRRDLLGGAIAGGLMASPLAAAVRFDRHGKGFDIGGREAAVPIFADAADWPGVRRAAADLGMDIGRVLGTDARLVSDRT